MNTKLNQIGLVFGVLALIGCLVGAVTTLSTPSQAQSRSNRQPEAIYVGLKAQFGGFLTNQNGDISRPQVGMAVAWVSRSQHAPEIPVDYPAAEAIAYLHGLGYQVQWLTHDKIVGVR